VSADASVVVIDDPGAESPPTLCVMSVSVTFESGPPDFRKESLLLTAKVADDVPG
jgi:hypothetical protein